MSPRGSRSPPLPMFGREVLLAQLQHAQAMVDLYRGLLKNCDRLSPAYAEAHRSSLLASAQLGELAFLLCGKSRDRAVTFFARKYGMRKADVQREAANLRSFADEAILAGEARLGPDADPRGAPGARDRGSGGEDCVEGQERARRGPRTETAEGAPTRMYELPKEVDDIFASLLPAPDLTGLLGSALSASPTPSTPPASRERRPGDADGRGSGNKRENKSCGPPAPARANSEADACQGKSEVRGAAGGGRGQGGRGGHGCGSPARRRPAHQQRGRAEAGETGKARRSKTAGRAGREGAPGGNEGSEGPGADSRGERNTGEFLEPDRPPLGPPTGSFPAPATGQPAGPGAAALPWDAAGSDSEPEPRRR